MKKSLIAILAMLLMLSCQVNELAPEYVPAEDDLYASIESLGATKTVMDENNNVLWSEEDQLVAFMGTTLGTKYQIKEQYVGTTTGGFSKIDEAGNEDDLESGQEIDHNVVLYPHSTSVWCMKNDSNNPTQSYKLNVVLPETQAYEENSFGIGAFPMIAVSTDNKLTFRNICGGLKLQFKGVDKIKSIKLEGLGGEKISGKSTVVGYVNGIAPTIAMAATDKSYSHVILDCGEGVQLSEATPTTFIIAVPPVEFASGMKITVTDTDGLSRTLTNSSANTIKRSCLTRFPVITYKQDGVFDLPEGTLTSYEIPAEGGTVEIPLTTNQEYEVVIPEDAQEWISVVETRVVRNETVVLNIAENTTAEDRTAEVLIAATDGTTLQTITVFQDAGATILPTNPDEFALVDLGLSVKWANYNMGAQTPYEVGTATDWGHEEGKDASYPVDMNISNSKYDLVKATLGGDWRLPTAFDFMELEQNCTWTQVEINGVAGNLITGPNGNSIFLPNAKYWTGTAWERSTSNNDYIYGIQWSPEESVIASGVFNRPVQGVVRVIPQTNHIVNEIRKNTATVTTELTSTDYDSIDLGLSLRVSNDGSINVTSQLKEGNQYTFNLDNLSNGTTYTIKASYSILGHTINEEKGVQFRTLDATDGDGIEAEPIDVGLSVKWASWNIGATCPHDKGIKLPWGGISVNDEARYDLADMDISGTEYDPATTLWGPEWRLPSVAEWRELIGGYYRDYVSNAIGGILLKNDIFLPGSGITNYMSGSYRKGCYFLLYAYCYSGSLLGNNTTVYVRPVYDPVPQLAKVTTANISSSTVTLSSDVVRIGGSEVTHKGFVYSTEENPTLESSLSIEVTDNFSTELTNLEAQTTYYVKAYAINSFGISYGDEVTFTTEPSTPAEPEVVSLSQSGTANSYIVSSAGSYKFSTVKGNSSESVGAVAFAEVLWESFGTDVTPKVGDLVKNVKYADGAISFDTPSTFNEGNAVIAAKDASGTILWSWHIWLTDEPEGQEYYNNAGTMMDRNLGATSATPGDVGALGLLYQWGRKDPFLGSSSISDDIYAESTITWPSTVESDSSNGTIEFATANPTTFITCSRSNYDWYYTGSKSADNTRWTTSESNKSIYDPCPVGWRVPDGGNNGEWSKAASSSYFHYTYNDTKEGMNFSGKFGPDVTIWYPASGFRPYSDGLLDFVGYDGFYWSAAPVINHENAYMLAFYNDDSVYSLSASRASGHSVRCIQE